MSSDKKTSGFSMFDNFTFLKVEKKTVINNMPGSNLSINNTTPIQVGDYTNSHIEQFQSLTSQDNSTNQYLNKESITRTIAKTIDIMWPGMPDAVKNILINASYIDFLLKTAVPVGNFLITGSCLNNFN